MRTPRILISVLFAAAVNLAYAKPPSDQDKQGVEAVNSIFMGESDRVKTMLDDGLPATAKGANGITLLFAAAQEGLGDLVRQLLKLGADPNRVVTFNQTAMHAALDHPSLLKVMMEYKGDVNFIAKDGESLLMHAAFFSRPEAVRVLLELGADAKLVDVSGRNALFYAMANKQKYLDEIYPLLIAQGAQINNVDKKGNTLLMEATRESKLAQVQDLIERGVPLWATNKEGQSLLDMLYGGGEPRQRLADILLARNPPQALLDKGLQTTLKTGEYWMTQKMLNAGARAIDPQLLFVAVDGKSWECLRQLLDLGLNANVRDSRNRTPLQHAVRRHNVSLARLLLQYGADINTIEGDDLLQGDIFNYEQYEDLAKLLTTAGLSPKLDMHGEPLRDYLKRGGHDDLAKLFTKPSKQACHVAERPLSDKRLQASRDVFVGIWDRDYEDKVRYVLAKDGGYMRETEIFGMKRAERGEWKLENSHLVLHTVEKGKPSTQRLGVHCIEKGKLIMGNSDEPMTFVKQPGEATLPPVKVKEVASLGPVGEKFTEDQAVKVIARIGCYSKGYTSDEERTSALLEYLKPSGINTQEEMTAKLGPYLQDKSFQGKHFLELMSEMLKCHEEI
jgi:ankyrin repeat protein